MTPSLIDKMTPSARAHHYEQLNRLRESRNAPIVMIRELKDVLHLRDTKFPVLLVNDSSSSSTSSLSSSSPSSSSFSFPQSSKIHTDVTSPNSFETKNEEENNIEYQNEIASSNSSSLEIIEESETKQEFSNRLEQLHNRMAFL